MLKRLAGWLVVLLATISLLLLAGGLIGAWMGRGYVDSSGADLLSTLESYLGSGAIALTNVDGTLADVEGAVTRAVSAAPQLAALAPEIHARITQVEGTVAGAYQGALALNGTLAQLNRMPGVNTPTFGPELETLGARLVQLDQGVTAVEQAIANRDDAAIAAALQTVPNDIAALRRDVGAAVQRFTQVEASLAQLRADVPWYTRMLAIFASLLTPLLAWGQVLLCAMGLRWARGQTPSTV